MSLWRGVCLGCVCLLGWVGTLHAQEAVTKIVLTDQRLQPLNEDSISSAQPLGVIGRLEFSQAEWLNDSQIIGLSRAGLWIYAVDDPSQSRMIPLSDPIQSFTLTPDRRWLWLWRDYNYYQARSLLNIDTEREVDTSQMMFNTGAGGETWTGHMMVLHPLDNHDFQPHFSNMVQVWDMSGDAPVLKAEMAQPDSTRAPYFVTHARASMDGTQLITAARSVISQQRVIRLWDVAPRRSQVVYSDPPLTDADHSVIDLQWNDDESSFAALTATQALRFSMPTGEPLPSFTYSACQDAQSRLRLDYARDVWACFMPSAPEGGTRIKLWRLSDGAEILTSLELTEGDSMSWYGPQALTTVSETPGDWILFKLNRKGGGGSISLVNYMTGETQIVETESSNLPPPAGSLSPNQTRVLMIERGSNISPQRLRLWDIEMQEIFAEIEPVVIRDVEVLPDGDVLTLSSEGLVRYSLDDQTRTVLPLDVSAVNGFTIHPDGTRLYLGSEDNSITIYDMATWEKVKQINNSLPVADLILTPDGRRLIVASAGSTVVLRDETGAFLSQVAGGLATSRQPHNPLLISPDGRWVSIGGSLYHNDDTALEPLDLAAIDDQAPDFIKHQAAFLIESERLKFDAPGLKTYLQAQPFIMAGPDAISVVSLPAVPLSFPLNSFQSRVALVAEDRLVVLENGLLQVYGVPVSKEVSQ